MLYLITKLETERERESKTSLNVYTGKMRPINIKVATKSNQAKKSMTTKNNKNENKNTKKNATRCKQ